MKALSPGLYRECREILEGCDLFDNIKSLGSFCQGITPLNELLASKLEGAVNKRLLVILNLKVLLSIKHKEYGCILPLFLELLRDNYYDEQDEYWNKIDVLRGKIREELEKPLVPAVHQRYEQKLFDSIIEINFTKQENDVIEALDWQTKKQQKQQIDNNQRAKRIGAFYIHGYDEQYRQKVLLTRLFRKFPRKFPELKKHLPIPISLAGMSEVSELWNKIAPFFVDSSHIPRISPEQIVDKILESLQTQSLIFIFSEAHSTYTGFLPDLIQEFWQPIVAARANHRETYLVMFLVDNKEKVRKSGVSFAWSFKDPEYPKLPLFLAPNSNFSYEQLNEWLNDAVKKEIVPQSLLAKTLLDESQGGVPELVYKTICKYCNSKWEGNLEKGLIPYC